MHKRRSKEENKWRKHGGTRQGQIDTEASRTGGGWGGGRRIRRTTWEKVGCGETGGDCPLKAYCAKTRSGLGLKLAYGSLRRAFLSLSLSRITGGNSMQNPRYPRVSDVPLRLFTHQILFLPLCSWVNVCWSTTHGTRLRAAAAAAAPSVQRELLKASRRRKTLIAGHAYVYGTLLPPFHVGDHPQSLLRTPSLGESSSHPFDKKGAKP